MSTCARLLCDNSHLYQVANAGHQHIFVVEEGQRLETRQTALVVLDHGIQGLSNVLRVPLIRLSQMLVSKPRYGSLRRHTSLNSISLQSSSTSSVIDLTFSSMTLPTGRTSTSFFCAAKRKRYSSMASACFRSSRAICRFWASA